MINFCGIVNELKLKIAEQMDYATQIEFHLSSKHAGGIVMLTRNEPVYDADELYIIVQMGTLNIGVQPKQGKGFNYEFPRHPHHFAAPEVISQPRRLSVSKVILGGLLELKHIDVLQKVEFINKEVELTWSGITTKVDIFLKLAEKLNITRCVCLDCCVRPYFLDLPNVGELKSVHFSLRYARFNRFSLNKLKATDIELHLKEFSHWDEDVEPAPLIASKTNSILKQWYNKERDIEWFRITSKSAHPVDTLQILLFGLPASIFWKYEGRCAELNLLKVVKYHSYVYSLGENNVVYTLDRGDKKLLILVEGLSEVIAQELTEDVRLVNSPLSGDSNCRKRKLT